MLRTTKYLLENPLIKEPILIVNIADVHSNVKFLCDALNYAERVKADLITIPGDLFDAVDHINNAQIVDELLKTPIKTVISIGNHDLIHFVKSGLNPILQETQDYRYFEKLKKASHISIVDDDVNFNYKGIDFIGFNPGHDWYFNLHEDASAFASLFTEYLKKHQNTQHFRVLLLHSCNALIKNNRLEKSINAVNLVLSGHNHAGEMPAFLQKYSKMNRGLMGPNSTIFMPACYGYWTNGDTSVILNNALTKMGDNHGPKILTNAANRILGSDIDEIKITNGNIHRLIRK